MDIVKFCDALKNCGVDFLQNEPMSRHTSFKIGGAADVFVTANSPQEFCKAALLAREYGVPVFVIGNGSNLLVSDGGIEGAVISLLGIDGISVEGETVVCGAGATLAAVCRAARDAGLTGLEFAYGIPGTVGGGIYMNAGAYGGSLSLVVQSAKVFDGEKTVSMPLDKDDFGYRKSPFLGGGTVLEATFKLKKGDRDEIDREMRELMNRRKEKQPLEFPSAGSTFKRPEGNFAGALIEKNGLKGLSSGGARVSEKHAGFIINSGGATAADVKDLIEKIKKTVYENDGVMLETEVISVGRRQISDGRRQISDGRR